MMNRGKYKHIHYVLGMIILFFIIISPLQAAQNPDKLYREGDYAEAAKLYDQLDLDHPKNANYRYNRGCATYQLKDYQRAQAAFSSVYRRADNDELRFKAMYNLGNAAFQAGRLTEAVDAYKQAIRLNPGSDDARYNLELALRKIKENEEKQNQEQNQPDDQQQNQQDGRQNGDDQQGQQGQQQPDKNGKDGKNAQDQSQKQDNEQEGDENTSDKQQSGEQNQQQDGKADNPEPQDLSGELKSADSNEQQQPDESGKPQQMRALERAKAEALIDNTSEDRSQYMRMSVPQDRRGGAPSGKYW